MKSAASLSLSPKRLSLSSRNGAAAFPETTKPSFCANCRVDVPSQKR